MTVPQADDAAAARERAAERELIVRVQGGDTAAFEALVARYVPRARAIARRLMRDADDADDLVQDAFLRALERIDRADPGRPFGPWFFQLLTNAGKDTHRRRAVRRTDAERDDIASDAPSPAETAEQSEVRRRFDLALAELPPRQRQIVYAYEVDDMSTDVIAEELGVSQVTVRWHLHQGRRALRAALADLR